MLIFVQIKEVKQYKPRTYFGRSRKVCHIICLIIYAIALNFI